MKGLLQVYTGDGKGKTTAALGLALRCLGGGGQVLLARFFKKPRTAEVVALERFQPAVRFLDYCVDYRVGEVPGAACRGRWRAEVAAALAAVTGLIAPDPPRLLIMDELVIALRAGLIAEAALLDFCRARPPGTEMVLTGRGATPGLVAAADLVTRMDALKHPWPHGGARAGIDY